MTQEKNLTDMEHGQTAGQIHAEFHDFLAERVGTIVGLMVNEYRAGDMSHDRMVGCIAEIACIHGIINELESRERRGMIAREREFGHGKA